MATADLYTVMNVPDEVIGSTFMKPFHSTQDAIDAALDRCGPGAMLYVIPDAGSVVPVLTP
jgi:hypothetical protein